MTPVESASVARISDVELFEEYQQAQNRVHAFVDEVKALKAIGRRIDKDDRRARRWEILGFLGEWARDRSRRYSDAAHRLDLEQIDVEDRAEAARKHCIFDVGDQDAKAWLRLGAAFEKVCSSQRIWDVTAQGGRDHYKSSAGTTLNRKPVRWQAAALPTVRPDVLALHLANANGADLWMYPSVLALGNQRETPALIRLTELRFGFEKKRFVESERPPSDAQRVGRTWDFVNRDGMPDRRFANNPERPLMLYGEIRLRSLRGLNETFQISDVEKAEGFARAFEEHRQCL